MATIKQYWHSWLWRDAVTRLITINFIVWLVVQVGALVLPKPQTWIGWFVLPGIGEFFPSRFWTIITYMFTHVDFMHMFVNMTWLLLFGELFCHIQSGRRLVVLYIYGGLCGGVAFLAYNAMAGIVHAQALGASCAVLAVIGAVLVMEPQRHINLFVFGQIKIMWLAIVAVVLFVVLTPSPDTFAAHLAGLMIGVAYALLRRHDIDIALPCIKLSLYLESMLKGSVSSYPGHHVQTLADEDMLDELLAKVSHSGYESLTPAERQRLFELSRNIKK